MTEFSDSEIEEISRLVGQSSGDQQFSRVLSFLNLDEWNFCKLSSYDTHRDAAAALANQADILGKTIKDIRKAFRSSAKANIEIGQEGNESGSGDPAPAPPVKSAPPSFLILSGLLGFLNNDSQECVQRTLEQFPEQ